MFATYLTSKAIVVACETIHDAINRFWDILTIDTFLAWDTQAFGGLSGIEKSDNAP